MIPLPKSALVRALRTQDGALTLALESALAAFVAKQWSADAYELAATRLWAQRLAPRRRA